MILYFHLPYFHVSNSAFLHSAPVRSSYIDVVLTLSMNPMDNMINYSDGCEYMIYIYIYCQFFQLAFDTAGHNDLVIELSFMILVAVDWLGFIYVCIYFATKYRFLAWNRV